MVESARGYNGLVLGVAAAVTLACCAYFSDAIAALAQPYGMEHEPKYSSQFV